MEDSFKARVERLFGSHLFETVPRSSFPESSWSVVEGEVEKKEWSRKAAEAHPGREETPLASSYDECFAKSSGRSRRSERRRFEEDLEDQEDTEEEKAEGEGGEEADDFDREERDIRSSIGLDSTLDYEEEEDEYDRAAVGMADINERIYMKDVKDHGPYINYHSIMEDATEELCFDRDPRADHRAASIRLREDKGGNLSPTDSTPKIKLPECDGDLKPILKRKKEELADLRPKKQVRFDPSSEKNNLQNLPSSMVDSRIPDYMRNPSKYVCYSLESEESVDEESNRRAFADFLELVKGRKSEEPQAEEVPRSIAFTPRKRGEKSQQVKEEFSSVVMRQVNVPSAEALQNETVLTEKDEMEVVEERGLGFQGPSRQYRSRPHTDD